MSAQTEIHAPSLPAPPDEHAGDNLLFRYVAITSLLSVGRHCVERHYARGTAGAR
ncbi:hypothetical protein ACIREO_18425 [Streptomyces sp. NPDC102441]|uniref:hypothetical protein n=1 Tax=Streptomyces sp. NPDC102441 TaxID=3366176 RepID=UPI00382ABD3C